MSSTFLFNRYARQIDYGNFNSMSGYTLTIVNSIGQTVFTTPINQQTFYIDPSTRTGTGIYFVAAH